MIVLAHMLKLRSSVTIGLSILFLGDANYSPMRATPTYHSRITGILVRRIDINVYVNLFYIIAIFVTMDEIYISTQLGMRFLPKTYH